MRRPCPDLREHKGGRNRSISQLCLIVWACCTEEDFQKTICKERADSPAHYKASRITFSSDPVGEPIPCAPRDGNNLASGRLIL